MAASRARAKSTSRGKRFSGSCAVSRSWSTSVSFSASRRLVCAASEEASSSREANTTAARFMALPLLEHGGQQIAAGLVELVGCGGDRLAIVEGEGALEVVHA